MTHWVDRGWHGLRRANRFVAVLIGIGLLALVMLVMIDIVARAAGHSIGGTDEISGYAMALLTAWGMGYALVEGAHVRIEALREAVPSKIKSALDLIAMTTLTLIVNVIVWRAWPVFSRSWLNDSHANTPLETPLWAVQLPWLLGWAWFAFCAICTLVLSVVMLSRPTETESK